MIKSMTGFGRGEYEGNGLRICSEIKAVNHRYCEISVKMPRRFNFAEEKIKSIIKEFASRGKIEIALTVYDDNFDSDTIHLNITAAKAYVKALDALNKEVLNSSGSVSLSMLAQNPDILKTVSGSDDEPAVYDIIEHSVRQACISFDDMRHTEGLKLAEDILMRGKLIDSTADEISLLAPDVKKNYYEKLRTRINELLNGEASVAEDKILNEAAIYADKIDITEEITRLKSHCSQLKKIMTEPTEPIGKKLDFLVQEMNRESNTIGSKCNDINITEKVLFLKNEIEKIREQVQNIE